MSERRYTDDEVAEIFARASETEQATRRQLPGSEGLTLAELQTIGGEAGLAPELVAQAARSIDQPRTPRPPTFLGLPLGAARTVRLERRMTDDEWERLVVDLRETFDARGVVRVDGSLRSWSNGNLQALVEPDGEGQQVRLRTIKGSARPFMFMGLGLIGGSLATFLAATLGRSASPAEALASVGTMGALAPYSSPTERCRSGAGRGCVSVRWTSWRSESPPGSGRIASLIGHASTSRSAGGR